MIIGIDLGGTTMAGVALRARDRTLLARASRPTGAPDGVTAVLERVVALTRDLCDDAPVAALGLGVAGLTDHHAGRVVLASNLGWRDVAVRDPLEQALAVPVVVDKDTNVAALGEHLAGAGRAVADLLYVTVGTGIGGGLIVNGYLYRGTTEGAADIGHLVLDPDGPACGCGNRGCLEALASGPAILNRLREYPPARGTDGTPQAECVAALAQQGDERICAAYAEAGRWLGLGLAHCVNLLNPALILIGGGVAAVGEILLAPTREALAQYALPAQAAAVRLARAGLGPDAGPLGAALLGLTELGLEDVTSSLPAD